jgi:hypothetical protein
MERTTQFVGQSLAFLDSVERASRAALADDEDWPVERRGAAPARN